MSESEAPVEAEAEDVQGETPEIDEQSAPDAENQRAEIDKWKALSRKNEDRAKENAEKAKAWDEHQASKADADKEAESEKSKLVQERDDAQHEVSLLRAVITHGLDADDVSFLKNVPADEVEEAAKRLAQRVNSSKPKQSPDRAVGRETPPDGEGHGDFLRNAFKTR